MLFYKFLVESWTVPTIKSIFYNNRYIDLEFHLHVLFLYSVVIQMSLFENTHNHAHIFKNNIVAILDFWAIEFNELVIVICDFNLTHT